MSNKDMPELVESLGQINTRVIIFQTFLSGLEDQHRGADMSISFRDEESTQRQAANKLFTNLKIPVPESTSNFLYDLTITIKCQKRKIADSAVKQIRNKARSKDVKATEVKGSFLTFFDEQTKTYIRGLRFKFS